MPRDIGDVWTDMRNEIRAQFAYLYTDDEPTGEDYTE